MTALAGMVMLLEMQVVQTRQVLVLHIKVVCTRATLKFGTWQASALVYLMQGSQKHFWAAAVAQGNLPEYINFCCRFGDSILATS